VRSYQAFGLLYAARNARARDSAEASAIFLWAGRAFGRRVVRDGFGDASAVYTFNTAALEILAAARAQGLRTVLEQTIAPRAIEEELMRDEQARHRDWEPPRLKSDASDATAERESQEWGLADLIVCGSEFVRDGIQRCGGPVSRCVVVPYGVDAAVCPKPSEPRAGSSARPDDGHEALERAPAALAATRRCRALPSSAGSTVMLVTTAAELSRYIDLRRSAQRCLTGVKRADVFSHHL
jgi:hypothetical protein